MLLPSALRRKAGAFLEDGIGKKYYQKQVEGGVLLHPRQASCGYLGCIPAVGSVTCCGPAPLPTPPRCLSGCAGWVMHRDLPLALNYGLTWPWRKQTFQERATAALKLMSNRGNETLVPFGKKKKRRNSGKVIAMGSLVKIIKKTNHHL